MTGNPDDAVFTAWKESAPVQSLLRGLWEAVETARAANNPLKRDAAVTAVGAATGAFLEGTGVTEQLRRQMLEHVLGKPGVDPAHVGKTFAELTRSEMLQTRGGEATLRGLAERGVLTLFGLLGATFSTVAAGDLRKVPTGREGVFSFFPKARVAKDSGPAHDIQEVTVARLGYTVGAEDSQLRKDVLMRAVAYYNARAAAHGLAPVQPSTVRDWCQRSHGDVYESARRDGAEARRNRNVDPKLIL